MDLGQERAEKRERRRLGAALGEKRVEALGAVDVLHHEHALGLVEEDQPRGNVRALRNPLAHDLEVARLEDHSHRVHAVFGEAFQRAARLLHHDRPPVRRAYPTHPVDVPVARGLDEHAARVRKHARAHEIRGKRRVVERRAHRQVTEPPSTGTMAPGPVSRSEL